MISAWMKLTNEWRASYHWPREWGLERVCNKSDTLANSAERYCWTKACNKQSSIVEAKPAQTSPNDLATFTMFRKKGTTWHHKQFQSSMYQFLVFRLALGWLTFAGNRAKLVDIKPLSRRNRGTQTRKSHKLRFAGHCGMFSAHEANDSSSGMLGEPLWGD